ncbi:MAG: pyridoxal phosphate-dependent aminotransferase [Bacillota bacterium]
MKISKKAGAIAPSLTLAITAKANAMKAKGQSIIGFGAGEPDFTTPEYICNAAKKAMDAGHTKYTPSAGLATLRGAICAKLDADNGLEYTPNQIVVSNGAKHSLYNSLYAIIDEGEEVIIPVPFWLTYPELVNMVGGVPVYVDTTEENGFKMTAAQLEAAITPKTRAIILNSPSNPCGAVYSKSELEALAKVLEDKDIYVISDEIYEKLIYSGAHHSIAACSDAMKERTIIVNGLSKSYAMTGWRMGYVAAPLAVAKAIDSVQSHMTSNISSITQYAAIAALTEESNFITKLKAIFTERRDVLVEGVNAIDGLSARVPNGAFYVFVNITEWKGKTYNGKKIESSIDICDGLLDVGIAPVPGAAFGDDDFVRFSYAISVEDIKEGLARLASYGANLV